MLRMALCQYNIIWENKALNLKKVEAFVAKAKENKADIILLPEMSLTGFSMNTASTSDVNEETKSAFKTLANKNTIAIGFGWVRKCDDICENVFTVVDKNGCEIAEYVKIHPFSFAGEDKYFRGGNKLCNFEFMGVKIGICICYDLRFPYVFKGDYDLMLVPANWPEKRREHWLTLLKARAIENAAYIAGINCCGNMQNLKYSGDTSLFAPDGKLKGKLDCNEGLLVYDIDEKSVWQYRQNFPVLNDRKEI